MKVAKSEIARPRFPLPLRGVREGRSYESIPARAESPRTQVIAFLFGVAAPLPQPLPKGGEQMLFQSDLDQSFLKFVGHLFRTELVSCSGNGCRLGVSVRILSSRPASLQIFPKP
jgi:hypothetical protein